MLGFLNDIFQSGRFLEVTLLVTQDLTPVKWRCPLLIGNCFLTGRGKRTEKKFMKTQQTNLKKSIEKIKSFDKRLSLLFNALPFPIGDELDICLNMIQEKAKYGEHFAQIAYMCEKKKY